MGNRAFAGGADCSGEFGQDSFRVSRWERLPVFPSFRQNLIGDVDGEFKFLGIDGDLVAILHQPDDSAFARFGADVTDHEALRGSAKAAIGEESDVVAEALPYDRGGDAEHFAHAGAAFGALVADDDHVTFFDLAGLDGGHRVLLGIVNLGRAGVGEFLDSSGLDYSAEGGEVSVNGDEPAGRRDGVRCRSNHELFGGNHDIFKVFGHGFSGDGHAVAMKAPGIEESLENCGNAADFVEVEHDVLSARTEVGEDRRSLADLVDFLEGEGDAQFVSDGGKVEGDVGRTTGSGSDRDCVFERFLGDDIAGQESGGEQVHHRFGDLSEVFIALAVGVFGRRARRPGKGHAKGFGNAGHGVSGVLSTAGTGTGADGALDGVEFLLVDGSSGVGTSRLERVLDGDVFVFVAAGEDGSAIIGRCWGS